MFDVRTLNVYLIRTRDHGHVVRYIDTSSTLNGEEEEKEDTVEGMLF